MEHITLRSEDIKADDGKVKFHITIYQIKHYELVIKDFGTHILTEMRKVREENPTKDLVAYYLPDIYVELENINGEVEPRVEIQTTSYGCMDINTFDKFLEALSEGRLVANYTLEKIVLPLAKEYEKHPFI